MKKLIFLIPILIASAFLLILSLQTFAGDVVSSSSNTSITTNSEFEAGANGYIMNWTLKQVNGTACSTGNTVLKQSGVLEAGNHTQVDCDYSWTDDNTVKAFGSQQNISNNGMGSTPTGSDTLFLNFTARLNNSENMGHATSNQYGGMMIYIGTNMTNVYYLMRTRTHATTTPPANQSFNCYLEINSTGTEISTVQRYSRDLDSDITSCVGSSGWAVNNMTVGTFIVDCPS